MNAVDIKCNRQIVIDIHNLNDLIALVSCLNVRLFTIDAKAREIMESEWNKQYFKGIEFSATDSEHLIYKTFSTIKNAIIDVNEIYQPKQHTVYIRPFNDMSYSNLGGITILFTEAEHQYKIQFSVCSKKDNFNKKLGIQIAQNSEPYYFSKYDLKSKTVNEKALEFVNYIKCKEPNLDNREIALLQMYEYSMEN